MVGPEIVERMADELRARIPIREARKYAVVVENDLVGRTALAILWQYRSQLTVHLVTTDPSDRNILALKSGMDAVRNAPDGRIRPY